jgi:hypothetical protein
MEFSRIKRLPPYVLVEAASKAPNHRYSLSKSYNMAGWRQAERGIRRALGGAGASEGKIAAAR